MIEKEPTTPTNQKAEKLSSDIYTDDLALLTQTIEEKGLTSRKEGLHAWANAYRGINQDEEKQETSDCEFFLSANKKSYCVYESYGRHRLLISKEECTKCKIHQWKIPQKSKIPLCPTTKGLYNPVNCEACFQAQPLTFANCETQRFFRAKSEPQAESAKSPAKSLNSTKKRDLEILKEKERVKSDALKERLQLQAEAEKEKAIARNSHRVFHGAAKVDWGNSDGFDAFDLGDN